MRKRRCEFCGIELAPEETHIFDAYDYNSGAFVDHYCCVDRAGCQARDNAISEARNTAEHFEETAWGPESLEEAAHANLTYAATEDEEMDY